MRSPLTLPTLIGCAVVLSPKAALGRTVPYYIYRAPPTSSPTSTPSYQPSASPSSKPTSSPSISPSSQPSARPSLTPSSQPSAAPFSRPSSQPTNTPSSSPSSQPTSRPSVHPSSQPSLSEQPTSRPSLHPSSQPSLSEQPSLQTTWNPSFSPSYSHQPTSSQSSSSLLTQSNSLVNSENKPILSPLMMSLIGTLLCIVGIGLFLLGRKSTQTPPPVDSDDDQSSHDNLDGFNDDFNDDDSSSHSSSHSEESGSVWSQALTGLGWRTNSYPHVRTTGASIAESVSIGSRGSSAASGGNVSVSSGESF